MRLEVSPLGRKPSLAGGPLIRSAQGGKPFGRRESGKNRARFVAAEAAKPVQLELEGSGGDLAQGEREVMRGRAVDIADEAEREVIVLGINPARAGEPRAEQRQPRGDALRNLDGGEESGHGRRLNSIDKHSRAGV